MGADGAVGHHVVDIVDVGFVKKASKMSKDVIFGANFGTDARVCVLRYRHPFVPCCFDG